MFKYLLLFNLIFMQLNSFELLHDFRGQFTEQLNLFKNVYTKNIVTNNLNLIPRKIHQIWIGPKQLPEKFDWMRETVKKLHPTWEYKLWTNEDLKDFNLKNQEVFDSVKNIGAKADIFRYEILERFGGVYVDIDFELLKPLDDIITRSEFFGCLLCGTDLVSNGIIGSKSNHPILKECITQISMLRLFDNKGDNTTVLNMTGPYFFTDVITKYLAQAHNQENIIILPSDYFFPFPATQRENYWNSSLTRANILRYTKLETLGIHYWATSWQD
ncbi:MAG: glycosyltransferase [Candidatus Babeliales bacterium]|nr:glycosyltransferase [Candidatus Babeliales bacterium]